MLIRKFVTRRILRVLALAAVLFAFHSSPAKAVTFIPAEGGLLNSGESVGDMSPFVMTEANLTLALTFDNYPSDITVTITNNLEETVYSGGPYDQNLLNSTTTISLSMECGSDYNLSVLDSYGDGGTSWSLYVSEYPEVVLSSGVANGFGVAVNAFDIVCGCTDAESCNYDSNAVADDGSCTFADAGYDCDGVCLADMDADGVCDEFEVAGCQDAEACNYDANATDEDGSCFSGDGGTFCYANYSHFGEHGI